MSARDEVLEERELQGLAAKLLPLYLAERRGYVSAVESAFSAAESFRDRCAERTRLAARRNTDPPTVDPATRDTMPPSTPVLDERWQLNQAGEINRALVERVAELETIVRAACEALHANEAVETARFLMERAGLK